MFYRLPKKNNIRKKLAPEKNQLLLNIYARLGRRRERAGGDFYGKNRNGGRETEGPKAKEERKEKGEIEVKKVNK